MLDFQQINLQLFKILHTLWMLVTNLNPVLHNAGVTHPFVTGGQAADLL